MTLEQLHQIDQARRYAEQDEYVVTRTHIRNLLAIIEVQAASVPAELPTPLVTTSVLIDKIAGEQIADRAYAIGWNHCREAVLAAAPEAPKA